MSPLGRRLGRLELYSQIICNSPDPWITPARTAHFKLSSEANSKHGFDMRSWGQRDRQLAPGLTMTLPFMFGWIRHK